MTIPPTTPADPAAGIVDRCVCFDRTFASLLEEFAAPQRRTAALEGNVVPDRHDDAAPSHHAGATGVPACSPAKEVIEQTLDVIRSAVGCGAGCGLCVPYLRVALRTGRATIGLFER